MGRAALVPSLPLCALILASALAERQRFSALLNTEDVEMLADQVREGSLFAGRFTIKQSLWVKALGNSSGGIKHIPLAGSLKERFIHLKELYDGGFGEAWAAFDNEKSRPVILKFFYNTDQLGRRYHLNWGFVERDPELKKMLQVAAGECPIAQKLQAYAASDPAAGSRFMRCWEDHVSCPECMKGKKWGFSTTGESVAWTQPVYHVLEDCLGDDGQPLTKWIDMNHGQPNYVDRVLMIFKELMEGLNYLTDTRHDVTWIHHDLKPENLVVKIRGGQEFLKIIDFGGVTEVKPATATGTSIATTPTYAPPEIFDGVQYSYDAPWSYDMYAAGCTLIDMATGVQMYTRLHWELSQADKSLIRAGCPSGVQGQQCVTMKELIATKSTVEPKITQSWGSSPSDEDIYKFLYGPCAYPSTSWWWMPATLKKTQQKEFGEMLVKMLALQPSMRPRPADVLQTEYMQNVRTFVDPDYK
mmetsp:Transcript_54903/g.163440  ORF Transcript_54903/g.163440 Transcript_54903/m.163440 type:complete len:472 (-) Transcript_54903:102-1517(-)|eukprot:CAMPEP_0175207644 /NCGR_PEP_ID=MMETSP0093-20121207/13217_1 /TAXON_ID=311494 /ORGANISM="Alexandrium monilatum, Strain CCMP3105" /LENGTH=471 /DNA_ID=CAMNT_0016500811 /DNA_START=52 /DNA_END=1467 /DNA_ORIENTATION=-